MASFQYTTIGAGIGASFGLPGVIVGGLLGGFLDMFNYAAQQQAEWTQAAADAAAIQAQQTALAASLLGQETALIGQQAQLGIQKGITETQLIDVQDKVSAYQTFLSKIPTAGEALTATGTGDLEFDRQYRALLGNLGNLNVLAGATGNVGPGTSMALVQEAGKADVGSFVWATQDVKQRQLDVFKASASMLTDTLTTIGQTEQELADALAELEILKNTPPPTIPAPSTTPSIADWWNDPNNWLNPAHWFD